MIPVPAGRARSSRSATGLRRRRASGVRKVLHFTLSFVRQMTFPAGCVNLPFDHRRLRTLLTPVKTKEGSMSSLRAQLIAVFAIFTLLLIHPSAQSQQPAPIPADPHELVTGSADVPASPAERASALGLLERARQNADMHIAGSAPFILKAEFTSGGGS